MFVDGPQLAAELIQLYLHDADANINKLDAQLCREDVRAVGMTLHGLKGSCRQIGGLLMGDILEEMEGQRDSGGVEAVRRYMPRLEKAFLCLRQEMEDSLVTLADDQRGR